MLVKNKPDGLERAFNKVNSAGNTLEIRDNGGRRSGIDRRYYSYTGHIPERRNGFDRRQMEDRRHHVKADESIPGQQGSERRTAWGH